MRRRDAATRWRRAAAASGAGAGLLAAAHSAVRLAVLVHRGALVALLHVATARVHAEDARRAPRVVQRVVLLPIGREPEEVRSDVLDEVLEDERRRDRILGGKRLRRAERVHDAQQAVTPRGHVVRTTRGGAAARRPT